MSSNRSVQAAQRRRAGPTDAGVGISRKTPQPSINSSQMFAGQSSGPTGRLQQSGIQQKQEQPEKLSNVSKMTIPQAITLITLRLGAIESKLLNMPEMHSIHSDGNSVSELDSGVMQSVMLRLESLEKRSGTGIPPELNLLKQQFEAIKQSVVQTKGSSANLIKENVLLKSQIENLRKELVETKEILTTLQNLTIHNSQQILDLSKDVYPENFNQTNVDELTEINVTNIDNEFTNLQELHDENDSSEILGNNLKQIIESELNTSSMNI